MKYKNTPTQSIVGSIVLKKDALNRLMTNERFCRQHNIGSESDVIRLGLNKVLREYEQIEFRQQVS